MMELTWSRRLRWSGRRASLSLAILALASMPMPVQARQSEESAKKIEEIQAQIESLSRQLEELKAAASKEAETEINPARPKVDPKWVEALEWREIGPAAMGGRIVALAVVEDDPSTFWVATASGGLLKTTNNGISFEHQFDREATVSIGDVAVAKSDPNIVWVGTGEQNPRNSVSYGDGVYKSTDGGKTWTNMGLKETYQIGKVLIHPTDPNIVYVGALGRLYGPNQERGLYKTTNGGETWEKVFYLDENTGIIDAVMHPNEPDTLLVAAYERRRDEFDVGDPAVKFGQKAGIYKTTDGGKRFTRLTEGLPTCKLGRIGLDWYRKDPDVVFAIVESERIGEGPKEPEGKKPALMGIQGQDAEAGASLTLVTPEGPAARAGLQAGDIVSEIDGKKVQTYQDLIDVIREKAAGDTVSLKARRGDEEKTFELTFAERGGQGGDPDRPFGASLGGQQENKQDEQGEEGFQTGGVYKSTDGGETWTRINSLNTRPMYFSKVRVDPNDDQLLYVLGIALYRSRDGGKTFSADASRDVHADHHALWIDPRDGRHLILGTDGGTYVSYDRCENWDHLNHLALGQFYHVALDTRRLYHAYGGLQDNGTWGGPVATRNGEGPANEDWLRIGGGDGFQCQVDPNDPDQIYFTSQYGALQRINLRTGERAGIRPPRKEGVRYRWNWNSPFRLSAHNSRIYYAAGNYVFKSLDRGDDLAMISPEITRTDRGSATALGESPVDPGVLYVGTDDGALWVTRDGGVQWVDVTDRLGLPGPRGISTIEPSRFEAGRCYVAVDGHRNDDDHPYLFVTEDYGQTWESITANLPRGSTRCLREDVRNEDLLYCGTEFALWFSVDRGSSWQTLDGGHLPTVAIHEVAVHPTAGEIVAATHGRSLWVLDVTPLQQLTEEVLSADAHLFDPLPAVRWKREPSRGGTNRKFYGDNPVSGGVIYYSLLEEADEVSLKIVDAAGDAVQSLRASRRPGLHRVIWDLTRRSEGRGGLAGLAAGRTPRGTPVPPGTYGVILDVDGETYRQTLRVDQDPTLPVSEVIVSDDDWRGPAEPELRDEDEEDELILD
ncbi:VPS10 domain-containing protein [Tautonia sociabilis]|uniref:PDZ domain-containing protein n=1 Tax=Tautonia sociabilis TaxID=2080755 RepID=A0A432MGY2_9BACT|nr:PDZ domain-containing protein [Tautonia sociabilis]RUL86187.1 PDZ domain-containing protein [Tautonia sociabilis]